MKKLRERKEIEMGRDGRSKGDGGLIMRFGRFFFLTAMTHKGLTLRLNSLPYLKATSPFSENT